MAEFSNSIFAPRGPKLRTRQSSVELPALNAIIPP
jgi:hypothetical protein